MSNCSLRAKWEITLGFFWHGLLCKYGKIRERKVFSRWGEKGDEGKVSREQSLVSRPIYF